MLLLHNLFSDLDSSISSDVATRDFYMSMTPFSLTLKVVLVRPLQRDGSWGTVCERSHSEQFFYGSNRSTSQSGLVAMAAQVSRSNRMYRTTCFAPKVTSSLPFKVRFRSHCTLERSKPLLIRPAPLDHLGRWSSGAVQKSTSWTTLTVLTHLRTAPEERVLVRALQSSPTKWVENGVYDHTNPCTVQWTLH